MAFYLGVLAQLHSASALDQFLAPVLLTSPAKGFDLNVLREEWQTLEDNYAHKDPDPGRALTGALNGLVRAIGQQYGDDYSFYETPQQLRAQQELLSGSFGGIGARMQVKENLLSITSVIAGGPAERAGLKANDVVVQVDGQSVAGLSVDAAVAKIRGKVGTRVRLGVHRGAQTLDYDIVRQNISNPSVFFTEVAPRTLYVRITDFGEHSGEDFDNALQTGLGRGDSKIILDLRHNPGGFVSAADRVSSEFMKSGVTVTLVDRAGHREDHHVSGTGRAFTQPLVVLIDQDSASAAEIVAGALKDNHRAYLIGTRTLGKGLVEQDFPLSNGGDLHLTTAFWYTPSGHSIQKASPSDTNYGVTPNASVTLADPNSFYDISDPTSSPRGDSQLVAALQHLR